MAVAKKEATIITEVITKVDKTEVVAVTVATTVVDPTTTMVAIKVAINKTRRIQLTESQS